MDSEELSLLRPTSIVVDAPPQPPQDDTVVLEPAKRKMPSLNASISISSLKPSRGGRQRRGPMLVGLDIQPGYVSAVQARVNGSIQVQKAAGAPLPPDTMREGEVLDGTALADTLREMFREAKLDKRVRIGVANQRTVLRTLELPPLTDRKELATAVRFQAEDQVPMPLDNAVLDFHPLGVIDTPAGPRQRVIVVAAQRDMVERLIAAVRAAGLRPEGVDLSAFALIRSLHRADEDHAGRVLYLNVGGLTNMAIAEGTVCRFTRVIGGGLESMAADIAERNSIKLTEARELLAAVDLDGQAPSAPSPYGERAEQAPALDADSYEQQSQLSAPIPAASQKPAIDVRPVLASGVREIAGEVRNSLDFHRSQDGGGEVSSIVLSGSALQISGFARALQSELRVPLIPQTVGVLDERAAGDVAAERLAVATGLAVEEAPR
ncbi:MAG TPA: type IV pilus assembly protein PilM [Solirubrobacteraceae bacterium]|jgi:type IV pilus assembly protein PilM|nr:type IV pilus assembly protein PilM [Solirubrobacteraceae bacterium]